MRTRPLVHLSLALLMSTGCKGEGGDDEAVFQAPPTPAASAPDTTAQAPAPTPAPATPAPTGDVLASTLGNRVYTVQVGGFTRRANADALAARMRQEGLPVWNREANVGGETIYRVRVGALTDRAEAMRFGDQLGRRFGAPVWVAPVQPDTRLPQGILESTRRVLQGG